MTNLLKFDEVEQACKETFEELFASGGVPEEPKEKEVFLKETEDSILDLLIMAYVFGCDQAGDDLGIIPEPDENKVQEALNLKIDGKTYVDRLQDAVLGVPSGEAEEELIEEEQKEKRPDNRTPEEKVKTIMETESHRMYGAGGYDTASGVGTVSKTWVDAGDDRVRETHEYINGLTIELDERFYTFEGDSARYPGDFTLAQNNIGCRCILKYGYPDK